MRKDGKNIGCLTGIAIAVAVLVLTFAVMAGISLAQQDLFVSDTSQIWLFRSPWCYFVFLFELEMIALCFFLARNGFQRKGSTKRRAAILLAAVAINGCLLYGCITGVSVADAHGFTRHSMFAPQGEKIAFDQVVRVETGFRGKLFGSISTNNTGDFYYKVFFADGSVEDWGQSNSESTQQTWAWMLTLDAWLMEAGVPKTGSTANREYCQMDKEYVDILVAVIQNKPAT